jgi:hypothetical protein
MAKTYEPTEKQNRKWAAAGVTIIMPSDDEFKARWMKSHHGVVRGWGLGKRQWIICTLACTREYNLGIWQARVDALNGLDYQTPMSDDDGVNMNAYNLGYYRGYTEFGSLPREMGTAYTAFVEKYQEA